MNFWTQAFRSTDITSFSLASMTLFCRSLSYIGAFWAYARLVGYPYVILQTLNVLAVTFLPLLKNWCNILSNNKKIVKQGVFVSKVSKKILSEFQKNRHTTKEPGFTQDPDLKSKEFLLVRCEEKYLVNFNKIITQQGRTHFILSNNKISNKFNKL